MLEELDLLARGGVWFESSPVYVVPRPPMKSFIDNQTELCVHVESDLQISFMIGKLLACVCVVSLAYAFGVLNPLELSWDLQRRSALSPTPYL